MDGSASEWQLPSSISWPDDCFLCLDDDANCGREDQQLGDARRVDREDHVWTDRSGLDSPKALLTSRIKTVAVDRHESTASHLRACMFSRKETEEPPQIGPCYGCLASSRAYRSDSGQRRSACSICGRCVWGRVCV